MANDYEDMSGIYEDEESPVSRDDILSVLEEQRRLEQEALAAALPLQRAEASALEADWRRGELQGRPMPTEPVEYAQGTVMPTSRGFMYMGNPLEAPPAGGPLATQRAFESAVLRQNRPEAFAAQRELGDMGAPLPTGYAGVPFQAPMPMDTKEQMQAEVMRREMAALGKGVPAPEALTMSGADAFTRLFPSGRSRQQEWNTPRPMNISGRAYLWNPATTSLTPLTEPKAPTAARATTAVNTTYKTLLNREDEALKVGDTEAAAKAKAERLALVSEHPELGFTNAPALAPKAPSGPVKVTTQAEFDRLPSGTVYLDKNGKRHLKP